MIFCFPFPNLYVFWVTFRRPSLVKISSARRGLLWCTGRCFSLTQRSGSIGSPAFLATICLTSDYKQVIKFICQEKNVNPTMMVWVCCYKRGISWLAFGGFRPCRFEGRASYSLGRVIDRSTSLGSLFLSLGWSFVKAALWLLPWCNDRCSSNFFEQGALLC